MCKANICKGSEGRAAGDEHRLVLVRVLLGREKRGQLLEKGRAITGGGGVEGAKEGDATFFTLIGGLWKVGKCVRRSEL